MLYLPIVYAVSGSELYWPHPYLDQTEEEIQTLRQVLGSKVRTAQDLKRRLGITVWREFTEDFNNSMKSVRESQT